MHPDLFWLQIERGDAASPLRERAYDRLERRARRSGVGPRHGLDGPARRAATGPPNLLGLADGRRRDVVARAVDVGQPRLGRLEQGSEQRAVGLSRAGVARSERDGR